MTYLRALGQLAACIAVSGWSFVTWFWATKPEDKARLRNMAGWLDDVPEPENEGDRQEPADGVGPG